MDDIDVSVTIPGDFWMSDQGFGRKGTGQLRMWETFYIPYSRYLRMVDTSRGYQNVRQEFQAQLSTLCCSEHIWPPSFGWGVPSCEEPGLHTVALDDGFGLKRKPTCDNIYTAGRKRHSLGMEESQLSLLYTIVKCSDWMGQINTSSLPLFCVNVCFFERLRLCWVGCSVQGVTILKENFHRYILSLFDGLKF